MQRETEDIPKNSRRKRKRDWFPCYLATGLVKETGFYDTWVQGWLKRLVYMLPGYRAG